MKALLQDGLSIVIIFLVVGLLAGWYHKSAVKDAAKAERMMWIADCDAMGLHRVDTSVYICLNRANQPEGKDSAK